MGFIKNYVNKTVDEHLKSLNIKSNTNIYIDQYYYQGLYKTFYKAYDMQPLLQFTRSNYPRNYLYPDHDFYRTVSGNIPQMHYPMAQIITKTMVNLVFSEEPQINVLSGNAKTDKLLNKELDNILDDNDSKTLFQKAAEFESYSGAVAFKFVVDPSVSQYPILQAYPQEDIEVEKKYDRIQSIVFRDYYKKDTDDYILKSFYGKGSITYKLYTANYKQDILDEVPLNTLPETAALKPITIKYKDGLPYDKILAVYKENKTGAESDYANCTDDFASIDEIYSNFVNFIRKSAIKTYRPENTLQQDVTTGEKYVPSDYDSSDVILYDSNPGNLNQEVKRDIPDIANTITGYQSAFNSVVTQCLMTTGLSPATVGIDSAGANSSAEALNIRERTTLRTRSEKVKRWSDALTKLSKQLIELADISNVGNTIYIERYTGDVSVTFAEYEAPTFDQQVQSLGTALSSNLIDLFTALQMLYPNKTDDELKLMMQNIQGQLPDSEDIVNNELNKEDDTDNDTNKDEDDKKLTP